jgi:hypothetical protein
MKAHASPGLGALLCAMVALPAAAQTFEPVLAARWENVLLMATVTGQDGRQADSGPVFHDQSLLGAFGPYHVSDTLGFDLVAPDGTAAVRVDHAMSHDSFIGTESVTYEARLDGSVKVTGAPLQASVDLGTATREGNFLGYRFDVAQPTSVALSYHADVMAGGSFELALDMDLPGGGSTSVFFQRADEAHPAIPLQTTTLLLAPGEYAVTARLVDGFLVSTQAPLEVHGAYSAGFSLLPAAAVPEPQSALLLAVGLPLLVAMARRARLPRAR